MNLLQPRFAAPLLAAAMLFAPVATARAQQPNPIPHSPKSAYPPPSEARGQVARAVRLAKGQHKHALIVFGSDHCQDCDVLAGYLRRHPNHAQILEHFLLVYVNVGPHAQQNLDLAERFGVPVSKGLPAVAVVDDQGNTVFSSKNGEFLHTKNMSVSDVTEFLNKYRQ